MVCDIASCTRQLISYAHKELTGTCLYDHNMYFIQLAGAALRKGRHMKIPKYSLVKELIDEHSDKNNYTQLYDYISANKRICLRDEPYEQNTCIEVPAEKHVADILGLHEGEVCVKQIRKTSSSITGKPLEYSLSFIRCEFFKVSITNR